jgi:hypothetical protein
MNKNVNHRSWLHGDFDGDKAKNVDDAYPLDKKRQHYAVHKNKKYHKKSYLIDTSGEVKLSTELNLLQRAANRNVPILKGFLSKHRGSIGRIKSVPSIMKKLREKHLGSMGDLSAATIMGKSKADVYKKRKSVLSGYSYSRKLHDDWYKRHKKNNPHRALHDTLIFGKTKKDRLLMELQTKTMPFQELDDLAHPFYKKKKPIPDKYIKKMSILLRKGY